MNKYLIIELNETDPGFNYKPSLIPYVKLNKEPKAMHFHFGPGFPNLQGDDLQKYLFEINSNKK